MNGEIYVFSQVCAFLHQRAFDMIVNSYNGDYRVRHFSCWNQLLCMMYGQLSNRASLSDLVLTINAHSTKDYHLGFGKGVSKANFAKSNVNRNSRTFQEFASYIIAEARKICFEEDGTPFSFSNAVYAFDSTIIDLCLSVFFWATFRKAKGAVKVHTRYDVRTSIPVFLLITAGSVRDTQAMDELTYEPGSFYIFDKGYMYFK